jgi:hypothetical protein
VVAFTFATAVVMVAAPLFGYKFSLVTSALEAPADEVGSGPSATGSGLGTDPTAPAYGGYARSLASRSHPPPAWEASKATDTPHHTARRLDSR